MDATTLVSGASFLAVATSNGTKQLDRAAYDAETLICHCSQTYTDNER